MGMNREAEVQRLNKADEHIASAEQQISKQQLVVERLRTGGHDTHAAERLLATAQEALAAHHEHRALIVQMIDQIDAGLA